MDDLTPEELDETIKALEQRAALQFARQQGDALAKSALAKLEARKGPGSEKAAAKRAKRA